MKAIMISIRPQHSKNILNGIKTLEIRKKFPKDYVGWVYIYCTKNEKEIVFGRKQNIYLCDMRGKTDSGFDFMTLTDDEDSEKFVKDNLNGKVVARFWCDKVEKINAYSILDTLYETTNIKEKELLKVSCLTYQELNAYLKHKIGYAIHIDNLEIFDKPKDIKEFYGAFTQKRYERIFGNNAIELDKKYGGLRQPTRSGYEYTYPLTRAPQSWCYVEI